jgi:hypothetical protein
MTAARQRQREITTVLMNRESHIVFDAPTDSVLLKRLSAPALATPPIAIAPKNPAPANNATVASTIRRIQLIESAQGIHDVIEADRTSAIGRATKSRC